MHGRRRFIGLMSGTSCDAVDGALVDIYDRGPQMRVEFIELVSTPYPERVRNGLLTIMAPAKTRTEDVARLNFEVGRAFAQCARMLIDKTRTRPTDITAIGSHGQTICHMPDHEHDGHGFTLQIGEAAVIAAETGVPVVADFRTADLAVGGEGAPLVPWTDYVLFRSDEVSRIIQNIGGIANVTYIPAGGQPADVVAFDTGPGCMVIDALMQRLSKKKHLFDPEGQYAARGRPHEQSVNRILQLPYFLKGPPKSAGREQFGRSFASGIGRLISGLGLSKYDRLATVTLLTARSIAQAYEHFSTDEDRRVEVILCGGGARNTTLVNMLKREIPQAVFRNMDEFGIPIQAKECISFAMLAAARLDGVPANLPQVTGAARPAILGKIVQV